MLVSLYDSGGTARRNALAAALGRDRTRLPHLLTRMVERGSVARATVRNGVEVTLCPGAGGNTVGG